MSLVVVVEDDAAVREIVSLTLQGAGYEVLTFANGTAMLRHLETSEMLLPVLLVTDYNLQNLLTGAELAAHLREHWPHLTVLVISGVAGVVQGIEVPWPVLPKPFSPQMLVRRVQELLPAG